jgi:TPR repeat protein
MISLWGYRSLLLVAFLVLLADPGGPLRAQKRSDTSESPVFRSYKPPEDLPLLKQSDPTYQSWQAFLAIQKANAGDPLAQFELALRFLTGTGMETDTVKAASWMKKAAEQDLTQARFDLALFYYHGWGVEWNPFESYRQFLLCAQRDVVQAQYAVGLFSIENLIMPEDWQKGTEWIRRAAEGGFRPAQEVLKAFEERLRAQKSDTAGPPSTLPEFAVLSDDTTSVASRERALRDALRQSDQETRRDLGLSRLLEKDLRSDSLDLAALEKSADAGSPEAMALLGRCAEQGVGMARDSVLAGAYFYRAARMESGRAERLLWAMVHGGELIGKVKERSMRGDAVASYVWAGLLALGFEVPLIQAKAYITPSQAVALLGKSADAGYLPALIELGLCSYGGRWVQRDERKAAMFWEEAERRGSAEARLRLAVTGVRHDTSAAALAQVVAELREASEHGAVLADVALGYCFEQGIVVARSFAQAAEYYRNAWRRGSQDAYRALRRLHDALRPRDPQFTMRD